MILALCHNVWSYLISKCLLISFPFVEVLLFVAVRCLAEFHRQGFAPPFSKQWWLILIARGHRQHGDSKDFKCFFLSLGLNIVCDLSVHCLSLLNLHCFLRSVCLVLHVDRFIMGIVERRSWGPIQHCAGFGAKSLSTNVHAHFGVSMIQYDGLPTMWCSEGL